MAAIAYRTSFFETYYQDLNFYLGDLFEAVQQLKLSEKSASSLNQKVRESAKSLTHFLKENSTLRFGDEREINFAKTRDSAYKKLVRIEQRISLIQSRGGFNRTGCCGPKMSKTFSKIRQVLELVWAHPASRHFREELHYSGSVPFAELCFGHSFALLQQDNPDPRQLIHEKVRFLHHQHQIGAFFAVFFLLKNMEKSVLQKKEQLEEEFSKTFEADCPLFASLLSQRSSSTTLLSMRAAYTLETLIIETDENIWPANCRSLDQKKQLTRELKQANELIFSLHKNLYAQLSPSIRFRLWQGVFSALPGQKWIVSEPESITLISLYILQEEPGNFLILMTGGRAGHVIYFSLLNLFFCDNNEFETDCLFVKDIARFHRANNAIELCELFENHVRTGYPDLREFQIIRLKPCSRSQKRQHDGVDSKDNE